MKQLHMVDVVGQYKKIKPEIDAAALRVLESGHYIQGNEVTSFEQEVAAFLGVSHAIGCASGTDALLLALMAFGIGRGDEVLTTPFTFVATTEMIALLGATPVYVDIDPKTFNIDPSKIEAAITPKTKAILPVHLYGQSADMDPIMAVSKKHGIPVIEDMCQAIGTTYRGRCVGTFGAFGCLSFFPSKNLGGFGDAGMVITNDAALADKVRVIASHGSRIRYKHESVGLNSRLDAFQAALLRVKLRHLNEWNDARRAAASVYDRLFAGTEILPPYVAEYGTHIFHQYTIRAKNRDTVTASLTENAIPHGVYYPIPLHLQEAYLHTGRVVGSLTETEQTCQEVLSLPMHTELDEEQQRTVVNAVLSAMRT
jgi:dTDP-4-amino-4,6-dideoxygalactose transaminase